MHTFRATTMAAGAAAALGGLVLAGQLIPSGGLGGAGLGGFPLSSGSQEQRGVAPLGSASTVAVVIVPDKNLLRELRGAVRRDRIVADGERAFALDEGRIVALSVSDAGPLIGALDWSDRSIELIDASSLGGRDPRHRRARASATPAGHSDLARLSKKKTLTIGEAIRYLNSQQ